MALDKSQIIPFPLPEHLCMFISEQLDTPIELIANNVKAKALHIKNNRPFSKMILQCLETSNKPVKVKEGITFYIAVSKNIRRRNKKVVDCRSGFVNFSEKEIKDITDVFESLFRLSLVSYVDGAHFGNDFKKGKRYKAITEFLQKYNLASDDKAFQNYEKLFEREKKRSNKLVSKYL
ncbi:hypothetical protein [Thalassobellus citreus]|uniref:hypothetical protein n=1 Tax=Thalassobellus citreus TaxID=3367752 RepID=UPI00378FAA64